MADARETALTVKAMAWRCPADWLPFETTDALEECEEHLGQARAVAALEVALRLRGRGYNVYVAGISGTGRTRTARRVIEKEAAKGPVPDDLCYVPNFSDPVAPHLVTLPAGRGRLLRSGLENAAEKIRDGIAALRSSSAHRHAREAVSQRFRAQQAEIVSSFQAEVESEGFALVELEMGAFRRHEIAPVVGEGPVSIDDLESVAREGKLDADAVRRMRDRHPTLTARLSETMARARELGRRRENELAAIDRGAAEPLIDETLAALREAVDVAAGQRPKLDRFLGALREWLVEVTPWLFAAGDRMPTAAHADGAPPDPLAALQVNVLVDRSEQAGRPIVEEAHPDPARLFGSIESRRTPEGALRADLSGIRPGAVLRANGGFLLLSAHDLVQQEGSWVGLRRVLNAGEVSLFPGVSGEGPPPLNPEAVPIELTVVLVGTPALRAEIARQDPEFAKLFKIVALFDDHVSLSREHVWSYACFLALVIREEGLLHHDRGAVSRLLEEMVREAGGRARLSTNFRQYTDIAREASLIAGQRDGDTVTREDIEACLADRSRRTAFLSQRIVEAFRDDVLRIDVTGSKVGQVNGLAVVETSFGSVGYPVRITATAAVGRSGIIDIEREAELSGEIHTKASLILAGFLRSRFAQSYPLSMTASICFEQSYGGVDGDSASSAELAALLSALSGAPARQDLAVTGAVDQHGQVLAVGGINDKVEGFWRLCRERGLTGSQGVIIPASCGAALQVSPELAADVEAGRFCVHGIEHVGELIALLTGTELGERDGDGAWTAGLLGERIAERLRSMAEIMRAYGATNAS